MSLTEKKLNKWFLQNAKVTDLKKGYVVVSPLNIDIHTDLLEIIITCWAKQFSKIHIDSIVGIPDAGARYATPLALKLKAKRTLPAKKRSYPIGWEKLGKVVQYEARSFTGFTEEVTTSFIGGVRKGEKVLLVDDVTARGDVGVAAIKALQKAGVIVVGLAIVFDKIEQGGVERIEKETGVKVFSLIRIQHIAEDGSIILAT